MGESVVSSGGGSGARRLSRRRLPAGPGPTVLKSHGCSLWQEIRHFSCSRKLRPKRGLQNPQDRLLGASRDARTKSQHVQGAQDLGSRKDSLALRETQSAQGKEAAALLSLLMPGRQSVILTSPPPRCEPHAQCQHTSSPRVSVRTPGPLRGCAVPSAVTPHWLALAPGGLAMPSPLPTAAPRVTHSHAVWPFGSALSTEHTIKAHLFFSNIPMDGHSVTRQRWTPGCFHFLPIMTTAAVTSPVQVSLGQSFKFPWGCTSSGIARAANNALVHTSRTSKLSPQVAASLYTHSKAGTSQFPFHRHAAVLWKGWGSGFAIHAR